MKKKYICYVAGKSGGHIIPAMTHAHKFLQKNPEYKLLFFSADAELDRSIVKHYPFVYKSLPLRLENVPRKNIIAWPRFLFRLTRVVWQCLKNFLRYRPVRVVSMGGYLSVPVCAVAYLLKIPVQIHELNVVPGAAVKLVSKWAESTHLCFEKTKYYLSKRAACKLGSYPLRYTSTDHISRNEACNKLGIDPQKKILCVLGGSQGSHFINQALQVWARSCGDPSRYYIIHQTGACEVEQVQRAYKHAGIDALVFGYRNDLNVCYSAADSIVARAGAGTLFEVLFFKKPAIIIPLEAATTGHQVDNAEAMRASYPEFFRVLRQGDLQKKPSLLSESLGLFN